MRLGNVIIAMALLASLSACGQAATAATAASATPAPTAKAILARIYASSLKDAHYTISEQLPDNNGGTIQGSGEGLLVMKPLADSDSVRIPVPGGQAITVQTIAFGNTIYHRVSTDASWTASPGRSELAYLDETYTATIAGQEMTPQGKAWHITGDSKFGHFEIWVREKDNYPVKYMNQSPADSTSETMVFDLYNTGQTVSPPPPSQVTQGS